MPSHTEVSEGHRPLSRNDAAPGPAHRRHDAGRPISSSACSPAAATGSTARIAMVTLYRTEQTRWTPTAKDDTGVKRVVIARLTLRCRPRPRGGGQRLLGSLIVLALGPCAVFWLAARLLTAGQLLHRVPLRLAGERQSPTVDPRRHRRHPRGATSRPSRRELRVEERACGARASTSRNPPARSRVRAARLPRGIMGSRSILVGRAGENRRLNMTWVLRHPHFTGCRTG